VWALLGKVLKKKLGSDKTPPLDILPLLTGISGVSHSLFPP
jgi:hypothetical protein